VNTPALSPSPDAVLSPKVITSQSKSNFALSFFFLPRDQRRGITNFYALSRVIDDAVDEHGAEEGARQLQFWQEEIRRCYQGTPSHPLALAMQETIRDFDIPQKYLEGLLEGCAWDLSRHRYENFEELYQYCYRVAGCIGLISMRIFGLKGEETERAAEELGVALQLTNILRDIKSDAERGRIYIPQEDIRRYRLSPEQVTRGAPEPKLQILLKLMADRAETYYQHAFTRMKNHPRKPLIAAWIMGRIYYRILQKIRAKHYDVYSKKISLSKPAKLQIALWEYLKALGTPGV
jgi:phytoene synthase